MKQIAGGLAFDHAGVMMVAIAQDERIAMINRKACEVLQCDQAEANGANWFDRFIPESSRDEVRRGFRQIMTGELAPMEHFENPVITGSGVLRTVAWHNTVVRDEAGSIVWSLSSGQDVTEERLAQRALLESRERFRALFEGARDGMLVADATGERFVAANPAVCHMLGYHRDELLERGVKDIHPAESLAAVRLAFECQTRGELAVATDLPVLRKDGTVVFADVSSASLVLDGEPCLLGIFRDITEQKRLQAKLAQTQKLESLGLLAGGIAHDFNNILMGILGHASLAVRRTPEGHALQANLQGIMGAANQAADLCQQLLDYAGKSRAEPKTVNLNELVHQTKELIAPSASPNATLELALATDLPLVTGVVSQLRQILLNLILNGLESLEGAAGTVRVTTDSAAVASKLDIQWLNADELPLGASVSLVVEDTGCGMGPEVRDKIFDPFFSTKVEGRGLGLSAVLGIVRRHRGALRLESTPHRGTRFEILLPAAPGPSDPLSDE